MKTNTSGISKRLAVLSLAFILCLFSALHFTACEKEKDGGEADSGAGSEESVTLSVTLSVTGADGEEKRYPVTAKAGDTLLSAMKQAGILEESGIRDGMVYTISGETADYSADKSYWAFYMNGEYMMTGAGETVLTDGATYAFVRTFEK